MMIRNTVMKSLTLFYLLNFFALLVALSQTHEHTVADLHPRAYISTATHNRSKFDLQKIEKEEINSKIILNIGSRFLTKPLPKFRQRRDRRRSRDRKMKRNRGVRYRREKKKDVKKISRKTDQNKSSETRNQKRINSRRKVVDTPKGSIFNDFVFSPSIENRVVTSKNINYGTSQSIFPREDDETLIGSQGNNNNNSYFLPSKFREVNKTRRKSGLSERELAIATSLLTHRGDYNNSLVSFINATKLNSLIRAEALKGKPEIEEQEQNFLDDKIKHSRINAESRLDANPELFSQSVRIEKQFRPSKFNILLGLKPKPIKDDPSYPHHSMNRIVPNPWLYRFPPWGKPHNPEPPGIHTNMEKRHQEWSETKTKTKDSSDQIPVRIKVPSFSQYKKEVIQTILAQNKKSHKPKVNFEVLNKKANRKPKPTKRTNLHFNTGHSGFLPVGGNANHRTEKRFSNPTPEANANSKTHISRKPDHSNRKPDHLPRKPDYLPSKLDHLNRKPNHLRNVDSHLRSQEIQSPTSTIRNSKDGHKVSYNVHQIKNGRIINFPLQREKKKNIQSPGQTSTDYSLFNSYQLNRGVNNLFKYDVDHKRDNHLQDQPTVDTHFKSPSPIIYENDLSSNIRNLNHFHPYRTYDDNGFYVASLESFHEQVPTTRLPQYYLQPEKFRGKNIVPLTNPNFDWRGMSNISDSNSEKLSNVIGITTKNKINDPKLAKDDKIDIIDPRSYNIW